MRYMRKKHRRALDEQIEHVLSHTPGTTMTGMEFEVDVEQDDEAVAAEPVTIIVINGRWLDYLGGQLAAKLPDHVPTEWETA